MAPCPLGHVDLNKVISGGEVVASGWSSRSGGEGGDGTPSTGAVEVNGGGGRRKGDTGKAGGWNAASFPGITIDAGGVSG